MDPIPDDSFDDFPFSLTDILSGLIQFTFTSPDLEKSFHLKCPKCGLSITDIKHTGKMGCSQCYRTFEQFILPLISKVQGAAHHTGKRSTQIPEPSKRKKRGAVRSKAVPSLKERLHVLRVQLARAVELEAYEKAAVLRDKIKKLEQKQG